MSIESDLLKNHIADYVCLALHSYSFPEKEDFNTIALEILNEIQKVLLDDTLSDFDIVEKIVYIFEEYELDCGGCHDF